MDGRVNGLLPISSVLSIRSGTSSSTGLGRPYGSQPLETFGESISEPERSQSLAMGSGSMPWPWILAQGSYGFRDGMEPRGQEMWASSSSSLEGSRNSSSLLAHRHQSFLWRRAGPGLKHIARVDGEIVIKAASPPYPRVEAYSRSEQSGRVWVRVFGSTLFELDERLREVRSLDAADLALVRFVSSKVGSDGRLWFTGEKLGGGGALGVVDPGGEPILQDLERPRAIVLPVSGEEAV